MLTFRSRETRPRRGDAVYLASRKPDGQPNGYISQINYEDKTYTIKCYDGHFEDVEWDELEDCWTDNFGGMYYLTCPNEDRLDEIVAENIRSGRVPPICS